MATRPFEIKIADKEILAILKTFSKMDDIAKTDMKKAAREIATVAASAIGSALQATPQGQALARSIKISNTYKRGPVISIGGDTPKLRNGTPVGEIALGVEFGAYQDRQRKRKGKSTDYVGYRQFQPRSPREGRGNAGYFIFPTLKALQPYITQKWVDEVDRIRREWRERI
jgi:hypothetical protein